MTKRIVHGVVVEWSPTSASFVDGQRGLVTAGSLAELAPQLPSRDVLVAVSRRSVFVRAQRLPNAAKAEVRRILDHQIAGMFPVAAADLAYDFQMTDNIDAEGRLAVVVAMRSADLHSLQEQAKSAGLKVLRVIPVAMGSAVLGLQIGHPDGAVVHRNAEGLTIDIIQHGELRYSRVAPVPASAIGIEAEVSRTFAAALLPCCPTIAAGGLMVREAEVSTPMTALEALAGHGADRIHIEFITGEQLMQRERVRQGARLRMSLLLFAAAALLFVGVFMQKSDRLALANRGITKWNTKLRKLRSEREEAISAGAKLSGIKKLLDIGFNPAQHVSDAMTVAANAAPKSSWLTGIALERGKAMTLRGTTTKGEDVNLYQQALVDDPRFRDVALVFATNAMIEKTPVVQFSVSAFPVGNIPLVDTSKKGSGPVKK